MTQQYKIINFKTILFMFSIFFILYLFTFVFVIILENDYTIIGNIPIILSILGLTYFFMSKNILYGLIIFTLILVTQPLLTAFLSSNIDKLSIKSFVALKEIIAINILLILIIKRKTKIKFFYLDYLMLIFLTVYIIYFITSNTPLFLKVVSFREGFMIFVFYTIGRLSYINFEQLKKMTRIIIYIGLGVALFGLIERFFFDIDIWTSLGAFDYINSKFNARINEYGFPSNWFTYVNSNTKIRRIVGSILEPTSFSRFLAFIVLLSLYYPLIFNSKSFKKAFLFLFFTLIIGISRGGLVIMFIGIFMYIFYKHRLLSFLILPVGIILLFGSDLFSLDSGNAVRHFKGLSEGLLAMSKVPEGHGLGASGQLAVLYGNISGEDKVSESFIGSLGYQLGIGGVVIYILFNLLAIYYLFKNIKLNTYFLLLLISGLLGVFLTSFLANSAVAPISSALIFIYIGIGISYIRKEKKYE